THPSPPSLHDALPILNLGRATLSLALLIAAYGVVASLYGARAGAPRWVDSGRRAVYALALVLTVAFVVLEAAFLRSDFSFAVVRSEEHTSELQSPYDL